MENDIVEFIAEEEYQKIKKELDIKNDYISMKKIIELRQNYVKT